MIMLVKTSECRDHDEALEARCPSASQPEVTYLSIDRDGKDGKENSALVIEKTGKSQ